MNFNFGEVLARAWQIVWRNKVLWVFGIFAACSRGGGGGPGGGGGGRTTPGENPLPQLEQYMNQLARWIEDNPWIIAVMILLVLVFVVISIFFGTIGRIGLIRGTYQADTGAEHLTFGELFSNSTPYFWRVLGLSLLIFVITLIIFIPLALLGVAFTALTAGIGVLCLVPLICLLIPLGWALSVVIEQANAAIVVDDLGIGDGIRKGWEVVRNNIGTMILLALILFIGSAVVGFIIAIPVAAATIPLLFGLSAQNNTVGVALWPALLCCAVYFPVLLVLNGIITAYMQSVWTLAYLRLTRPAATTPPEVLEANA
jgi:membrane-anchored glycerophosphoryl diester phosphodiesterase (GDPDase)